MRAGSVVGLSAAVAAGLLVAFAAIRGFVPIDKIQRPTPSRPALKGTVFYRERIALPPNATAELVLEDISIADRPAVEIARATVAAAGQVPIPFELSYSPDRIEADHRYGVRAAILWPSGARMFVSPERHPAFGDGTPSEGMAILVQRVSETDAAADSSRRLLFECGGDVFFAVLIADGQATLTAPKFLGNGSVVLPQTEAGSGARYAAGDTVFWSKGNAATFQIGGRTFIDCMAARSGR
jgi:putative lipoprotein